MKKLFIKTVALSAAVVMLGTSCTKTGATGPAGSAGAAGPVLTGNIEGIISLYDDGNVRLFGAAPASATIVLTNNSTGATLTSAVSTSGTYTFSNVTTGTYSFTVSNLGYGTTKGLGFEFAGGGTAYRNFSIAEVPATNVTSATTNTSTTTSGTLTTDYVNVTGSVPLSSETSFIITFAYTGNTVSGVFGNYVTYASTSVAAGQTTFTTAFSATTLMNDYNFTSNQPIYFATYIYGQNSSYVDPLSGLTVYTALSSTPAFSSSIVP